MIYAHIKRVSAAKPLGEPTSLSAVRRRGMRQFVTTLVAASRSDWDVRMVHVHVHIMIRVKWLSERVSE